MTSELRKELAKESYDEKLDKVAMLIDLIRSVPKLGEKSDAPHLELNEPRKNVWRD